MPNEYITKADAIKIVMDANLSTAEMTHEAVCIVNRISTFPAAPVVEVVHARWEHLGGLCSACGRESAGYCGESSEAWLSPYCPECGAKMDLPGGYGGYKPKMDGGEPHAEQSNTQHEKSNV